MVERKSNKETQFVTNRYNRFAPFYNFMEGPLEYFWYRKWRKELWDSITGTQILEMGVGTGKNISFYPDGKDITAIDISENMLKRAKVKANKYGYKHLYFREMDIQNMKFPDDTFDAVVATFVFCSVPNPVSGLKEAIRVTRPGGKIYLLEHMLTSVNFFKKIMRFLDLPIYKLTGVHIARETVRNVKTAGWKIDEVKKLGYLGIFRMIIAQHPGNNTQNIN